MSRAELEAQTRTFGKPIYWAGPVRGFSYEFTRIRNGDSYVRYLPQGLRAGASGGYLTVATYPFSPAYDALEGAVKGKAHAGPGRSLVYVRPYYPESVLMAFHGFPYQVEVFDPSAATSVAIATSGKIQPVG